MTKQHYISSLHIWGENAGKTDDQLTFSRGAIAGIIFMATADPEISHDDLQELNDLEREISSRLYMI